MHKHNWSKGITWGVLRSWKTVLIFALAMLFVVLPLLWPGERQIPEVQGGAKGASLVAQKKLYGVNERPSLRLKLNRSNSVLGSWLTGRAFAATSPKVEVRYDDAEVDMPVSITQVGDDEYSIVLEPVSKPKPGKYTVSAKTGVGNTQVATEQTFAWGVLAANIDRTVYVPGETVRMSFGVLDSTGHTLCDAPVNVSLTRPSGVVEKLTVNPSVECKGDRFAATPDYTASSEATELGKYSVLVTLADTPYSQSMEFTVVESRIFDIVREGPTRLYPPASYTMIVRFTPQQTFSGKITDKLPAQFRVGAISMGGVAQQTDEGVTIAWDGTWQAGRLYLLEYSFTAPPVSPAFYEVGPLHIGEARAESRAWQMAGDATITLVNSTSVGPTTSDVNGDITGSVSTTTGNTLVLIFGENVSNNSGAITSITDSAGNTWTYSTNASNANPPVAYVSGTTSVNAIAYVTNATAITSVTVRAKPSVPMAFWVLEFSGIKTATSVIDANWVANATASTSHNSASISLPLCDAPTTDQLMRGGNYFCADDNALIVASMMAGAQSSTGITLTTAGFTQLSNLCVAVSCSGSIVRLGAGYMLTTTSSSALSASWTIGTSRAAALCIIAFRPNQTGSIEQRHFWAK